MKKKLYLFMVFLLLFQVFSVPFLYVEAGNDEQPETCNGPSEMMVNYFEFQKEMEIVILGTELNVERFSAEFGSGGLFTNRVLEFTPSAAVNLLSSRVVGNIRSFVSNSITSMFLLTLATVSVVQSNTEGFAILFADWPIVRDYKKMLDIETDLFDIAYFRSKEIDLTQPIDSNMGKELKKVINKYIDEGLLTGNDKAIHGSLSDVLYDLVRMNAVMKQFIMVGGQSIGNGGLRRYRGCFGNVSVENCTDEVALIMFNSGAVNQLYDDYKEVRKFGKCNSAVSNFKSTLNKTLKNNSDAVSDAIQDVKSALNRLRNVLIEEKVDESYDPCEGLSDYEIAQLQAYWGGNWKCGKGIRSLKDVEKYINDKIANAQQKKKTLDIMRSSVNSIGDEDLSARMKRAKTYQERAEYYASQMGKRDLTQYYSFEMSTGLLMEMNLVMDDFSQSQENAASADFITLLGEIRGLLDLLDSVINKTEGLKKSLKGVESKACEY